jgi:hypothetical protein
MTRFLVLTVGLIVASGLILPQPAAASCSGEQCAIGPKSSVRFQFGNGLPFPIAALGLGFVAPTGQINASNDARGMVKPLSVYNGRVTAGTGAPQSLMMAAGQMIWDGPKLIVGLFNANPAVFSVGTKIPITFPSVAATFAAGGRSGAATATYCPGAPFPGGTLGSPGCLGPNTTASGGPTNYPGIFTYTKTAAQFGGAAAGAIRDGATADVAFNVAELTALPCTMCVFGQQIVAVNTRFPTGNTWAFTQMRTGISNTPGIFIGSVNTSGVVTNVIGPTPAGDAFPGQDSTSTGGPWTTGKVSVSAPGLVPPEVFTITGSDQRTPSGEGFISMVAGSIANRSLSNHGGNRGWMTLEVPEPGLGLGLMTGLGMLTALVRRKRAH